MQITAITCLLFSIFIVSICISHLLLNMYDVLSNEVRWIYTIVFGSLSYYLQVLIINGTLWLSVIGVVINVATLVVLIRKRREKKIKSKNAKSKSLFYECLAVTVLVPILLSAVFFLPDMVSNNRVERKSPALTMYVYTNHYIDNTNHIHMSRYISENHNVGYFNDINGDMIPGSYSYPKLIHVVHSAVFDGFRITNHLIGTPVSDLSLLYFSYHLVFFLLLSMSCALLWYFARKHLQRLFQCINNKVFIAISLLALALIVSYPHMSMALYGFITQAASELILLLILILIKEGSEVKLKEKVLIPLCLLFVALGNVWWVLLPPILAYLGLQIIVETYDSSKNKLKVFMKRSALAVISIFLAAIPAFALVAISNVDISTQTILNGPYEPISAKVMFAAYALCSFLLLLAIKEKYNRNNTFKSNLILSLKSWVSLIVIFNSYVATYVVYQYVRIGSVNYYGNKLLWSSISLTLILAVYCLGVLLGQKQLLWKWTHSKVAIVVVSILVLFSTAFLAGNIVRKQQLIINGVLPQEKHLEGIIRFLDDNKRDENFLIYSQYNFTEDYIAMRFSYVIRPLYGERQLTFLTMNNHGNTPEIDRLFLHFLETKQVSKLISLRGCDRVMDEVLSVKNPPRVYAIDQNGSYRECELANPQP